MTDGPTDRRTDGPTKRGVESLSTRLKIVEFVGCKGVGERRQVMFSFHHPKRNKSENNQKLVFVSKGKL